MGRKDKLRREKQARRKLENTASVAPPTPATPPRVSKQQREEEIITVKNKKLVSEKLIRISSDESTDPPKTTATTSSSSKSGSGSKTVSSLKSVATFSSSTKSGSESKLISTTGETDSAKNVEKENLLNEVIESMNHLTLDDTTDPPKVAAIAVVDVDDGNDKEKGDDKKDDNDDSNDNDDDSLYLEKILNQYNNVVAVTESESAVSKSGSGSKTVSSKTVPTKNMVTFSSSSSKSGSGSGSGSKPFSTIGRIGSESRVGTRRARKSMSEETIRSGGDPEKEYLLNKKTQSMNYLTVRILSQQQQQKLAALHFDAIHTYCFFFPSIIITLMSGILAILVKSTLVPTDKMDTVIALVIAILSIVSTFFQSLMKQFDFSGRAGFHNSCATALAKLYMYSKLDAREATYNSIFESLTTNEPLSVETNIAEEEHHDGSEDVPKGSKDDTDSDAKTSKKPPAKKGEDDAKDTKDGDTDKKDEHKKDDGSISAQFRQAVDTCSSVVPIKISSAFAIMRTRLELVNKSTMIDKVHAKVDFSIVLPSLNYQLSNTILSYKGFPICLPDPEWAVEKTLRDWKKHLKNNADNSADLLGDLIERSDMIRHLGETDPLLPDNEMV